MRVEQARFQGCPVSHCAFVNAAWSKLALRWVRLYLYVAAVLRVPVWLSVLVTATLTAPAPWDGAVQLIRVALTTVRLVQPAPPAVAVAPVRNPVPVIASTPPASGRYTGPTLVTVGAAR